MNKELIKINNRLKTISKQMTEGKISQSLAIDKLDRVIERIDKLERDGTN